MLTKQLQRGFTLIEVMVVVVILSILAAMVVPKLMSRPDQARMVKAQQDILAIENALNLYKLDNGFYPSTQQGLSALVAKPTTAPIPSAWTPGGYLKKVPVDPWGSPYVYQNPGVHNEGGFDIYSPGPDPQTGIANEASVIGNWG